MTTKPGEPSTCHTCGGPMTAQLTTVSQEQDGALVVVRDVPAYVCERCGITMYASPVAHTLNVLIRDALVGDAEVTIVRYPAEKAMSAR